MITIQPRPVRSSVALLCVTVAALATFLAPTAAATPPAMAPPEGYEYCFVEVNARLYSDEAASVLVDELHLQYAPASVLAGSQGAHDEWEFSVPPAGQPGGAAVTGTQTGRDYLLAIQTTWRHHDGPRGTDQSRAVVSARLTTSSGRVVADFRSVEAQVTRDGHLVQSRLRGRNRGLTVHLEWLVRCTSVPVRDPRSAIGTGEDLALELESFTSGPFTATALGPVPPTVQVGTVSQDPNRSFTPGGAGTVAYEFEVPDGSPVIRFDLAPGAGDEAADLDLFLVHDGEIAAADGSTSSYESVGIDRPEAGTYEVWVHGWDTDGPEAEFTISSWVVPSEPSGLMTVTAPATITPGPFTLALHFDHLEPATHYLGGIQYRVGDGEPLSTIVVVDTP